MVLAHPDQVQVVLPLDRIMAICQKYRVRELAVFGSVLRDDFRDESDVDFLVAFENNDAGAWGCKFEQLKADLSAVLGRAVDVVDRAAVEESENYLRRRHILGSARTVYVA